MQIDNRRYAELFANDFYRVNEALIDKDPVTIQKEAFANEVAKFKHTRPEDEYIWISNSIDLGWLGEYPGWGKAIKGLGNYATKVPKTINANSKLPVVGNATGYGDIKVNGIITLSKAKYPETATHINDAINKGHPNILTIDRKEVKAELSSRAHNLAIKKGLQPGSEKYYSLVKSYIDPRNIPPMVIEDTIKNGVKTISRGNTFMYIGNDIKVITNQNGDVITVIPK
ncbi:hypothetical protein ACLQ91_10370 [Avibacterium endocarditidis]|uniref:hypothetical protein n=1 Tax=Avibacterium endocarditidis TaxID=380674 RepID=UPI0039FC839F